MNIPPTSGPIGFKQLHLVTSVGSGEPKCRACTGDSTLETGDSTLDTPGAQETLHDMPAALPAAPPTYLVEKELSSPSISPSSGSNGLVLMTRDQVHELVHTGKSKNIVKKVLMNP